jgi:hypothetical protein
VGLGGRGRVRVRVRSTSTVVYHYRSAANGLIQSVDIDVGEVRKCRSETVRNDTVPLRDTAVARHCRGETVPWRDTAVARHCRGETVPW